MSFFGFAYHLHFLSSHQTGKPTKVDDTCIKCCCGVNRKELSAHLTPPSPPPPIAVNIDEPLPEYATAYHATKPFVCDYSHFTSN